ncbi:MAG: SufD family Fe-S cluster assembly protein [Clostridiales bacterium]|jgi:Fe-S cluster assembly scaffold protein SufB|nr:SufD family Fe-S cluster assembly protein [Clostridiales bacterium]
MNSFTEQLLGIVSSFKGTFHGAYNLRENGTCAGRKSSANVVISDLEDKSGISIRVKPGTKNETVYIPACVTESGLRDSVTNLFYIGENADVTIIAGCGVHADGHETTAHSGTHRFFIEKNAHVEYIEKHVGTGDADSKEINTKTEFSLAENASVTMESEQIRGVNRANRVTSATLADHAVYLVHERLLTDGSDSLDTAFEVILNGEDSKADIVSRSVARGHSSQRYSSRIVGNSRCTGHSECDAILAENGSVDATPCLSAKNTDAALIHEAAIGKIAGEQITKLCTFGLTGKEAEEKIIEGFLK